MPTVLNGWLGSGQHHREGETNRWALREEMGAEPRKEARLESGIPQLGWFRDHTTCAVVQSPMVGLMLCSHLLDIDILNRGPCIFNLHWAPHLCSCFSPALVPGLRAGSPGIVWEKLRNLGGAVGRPRCILYWLCV